MAYLLFLSELLRSYPLPPLPLSDLFRSDRSFLPPFRSVRSLSSLLPGPICPKPLLSALLPPNLPPAPALSPPFPLFPCVTHSNGERSCLISSISSPSFIFMNAAAYCNALYSPSAHRSSTNCSALSVFCSLITVSASFRIFSAFRSVISAAEGIFPVSSYGRCAQFPAVSEFPAALPA